MRNRLNLRALPTWDLVDTALMGHSHSKAVLAERMRAVGAHRLIELVAAEAAHHGAALPVACPWDPAVAQDEPMELLALHPPHWQSA